MSRSKADILEDARKALDMLNRAKYGCDQPGTGELAPDGPVSLAFAIGWAKGCLRRALDLPDDGEKASAKVVPSVCGKPMPDGTELFKALT
jgi:hypothetical protein